MPTLELQADAIVYLFAHKFADDWVERRSDPVFGRTRADARPRTDPLTGRLLSEKSLAEHIAYAALAQLVTDRCVESVVLAERGWNYEVYDRAYLTPLSPFPSTPVFLLWEGVMRRLARSMWLPTRRRFEEAGASVDTLVAGLRQTRLIRGDPYQFVCSSVERQLIELGFYRRERHRLAGPLLATVWQPDPDRIAEHEFHCHRLQRDLERFSLEQPNLAAAIRDNVTRTMLKMRSDEDYATQHLSPEDLLDGDPAVTDSDVLVEPDAAPPRRRFFKSPRPSD